MNEFRFIHAADIHLDSPLKGLSGHDSRMAERISAATRDAFDRLVECAIEERVNFIIIAGDLYDGDWRDYKTGLFFASRMGCLHQAGIQVFLVYGNHDAESQITRRLTLPDNVKVFAHRKPESFVLDKLAVVLHGQSFKQRDINDNLALAYPKPVAGAFNIGVLHTGLGGMGGHANYAPCALKDLVNKGYDYWALGHVHQAEILSESPYIVFPGNLQGRHVRETGPKGAYLITVENSEVVSLNQFQTHVVRWEILQVDLTQVTSFNQTIDHIRKAIEAAVHDLSEERLLACRIQLHGQTGIHEQLLTLEETLLAEARSVALGLGEDVAWIEKLILATEPGTGHQDLNEHEDAMSDLRNMLQQAASDEDLLQRLENDIGALLNGFTHDLRAHVEDGLLKTALEGDYARLISQVTPYLSARLTTTALTTTANLTTTAKEP